MCLRLFLGADHELPLVSWVKDHPAFNVEELSSGEASVRKQFTKPHVYSVGAHTNCSCGFSPVDEPDEAERHRSVEALSSYLSTAARGGPLEMFVCWDGDWESPPLRRMELESPDLIGSDAWITEGTFTRVPRRVAA